MGPQNQPGNPAPGNLFLLMLHSLLLLALSEGPHFAAACRLPTPPLPPPPPSRRRHRFLCRPCPLRCPDSVPKCPRGLCWTGPPAGDTARGKRFALGLEEPAPARSARAASPVSTRGAAAASALRSPRPLDFWSQHGGTWGFGTRGDSRRRPETLYGL